jgi:hypothetical protein
VHTATAATTTTASVEATAAASAEVALLKAASVYVRLARPVAADAVDMCLPAAVPIAGMLRASVRSRMSTAVP